MHIWKILLFLLGLYIGNLVCWACLLLFCLVLSSPLLTCQRGNLYTEAEKAAVIWPLGAGSFFPLTTAHSPKGGKQSFLDDAVPFTTNSLKKFWEISGNHNWHCYFEGLMAYIITLYFLLSPLVFSKLGRWMCCTVLYGLRILPNIFYMQLSTNRLTTLTKFTGFLLPKCYTEKANTLSFWNTGVWQNGTTAPTVLWTHSVLNIIWKFGVKNRQKTSTVYSSQKHNMIYNEFMFEEKKSPNYRFTFRIIINLILRFY